jgi:TonB family protein
MPPLFRTFRVVAIVHVVLFVACLVVPGCMRFFKKKELPSIPVEFLVDTRPAAPAITEPITPEVPPEPEPPPAEPVVPEPEPEPVVPEPIVPEPEPEPPKPPPKPPRKRREIVKGPRIVRKQPQSPPKPRLSQEEIDRLLADGAKPSDTTSVPGEDARCEALIFKQFYEAWQQPSFEAAAGREALLILSFSDNGTVTNYRLAKKSGSDLLDRSVLAAARSVPRVFGLTTAFVASHREVTIRFYVK